MPEIRKRSGILHTLISNMAVQIPSIGSLFVMKKIMDPQGWNPIAA
jgi:hypothetical protein